MTPRLILLDVGKVLIDFDFRIAVKNLQKLFPVDMLKMVRLFKTSSLADDWDKGLLSPEQFFREVQREMDLPIDMERFASIWNGIFTEKRKMIELARSLNQNYKVFLLSNTNPWHAEYLRRNFSWTTGFDGFIASCEVRLLKPDPEIYKLALKKAGAGAEDTFYIDDVPENVRAAKKLGMETHLFTHYESLLDDLRKKNLID